MLGILIWLCVFGLWLPPAVPVESTTTLSFTTTQPVTVSTTDSSTEQTTTTTSTVSTALTIETSETPTDADPKLCGPVSDEISGIFGSVDNNLDGFYDNGVNCKWIFYIDTFWPKTVQSGVEIQITKMDIPSDDACRLDHFEIYDDNNSYGVFCGSSLPPNILVTSFNFSARFYSDGSINGEGFEAFFAVKDNDELCGGILSASTGVIESVDRDGDGKYDLYIYCVWVIIAPQNKHIEVEFTYFDLEDNFVCGYDSVELYDGHFISEASIGLFCGHQLPLRTVTSSNVLFFKFNSDSSVAGRGFYADYSYTDEVPADYSTTSLPTTFEMPTGFDLCGPTFTSVAGYFNWTGTNSSQDNGVNCLWIFRLTAIVDTAVTIQIVMNIDIPSEGDCQVDYLEIYDENISYGLFCGFSIQEEIIISTSGVFYAKFYSTSENTGNGNGFAAVYTVFDEDGHCGGVLTQPTGFIEAVDRDGDGFYDFDEHCVWAILAPHDQRIELVFSYIDIEEEYECLYDFVEVYDGQFITIEPIGRFCGSNTPPKIQSTSSVVFLEFYADSSYGGKGFGASFSFQQDESADYSTPELPTGPDLCGPTFTSVAGYFDWPGTNSSQNNDVNCLWIFHLPAIVDTAVTIQVVMHIDIPSEGDCQVDYLELYDENRYYGIFCGFSIQEEIIISTSGVFYAKFYSTSEITGNGNGFAAVYTVFDEDGHCGGVLTQPTGFIEAVDRDGDGFYDFDEHCVWAILAAHDERIELVFSYIDIEEAYECYYDFVEVHDGQFNTTESIGRFCGSDTPSTIHSTSSAVFLEFYADSLYGGTGFGASFSFQQAVCESCGCNLTAPSGWFTSPDADGDGYYEDGLDCYWRITADEGNLIELQFLEMEIEYHRSCISDFVQVLDGGQYLLGEYCGTTSVLPIIRSQKNMLLVHFHSDSANSEKGFKASYSQVEWSGPKFCDYIQPVEIGTFNSSALDDDSDGLYDHNVDCVWVLTASVGKRVQVYITNMDIPSSDNCEFDYLEIYDYNISIGIFCGTSQPPLITSTSNTLYIYFYSDATINGKGFQAYFSKIDKDLQCGEMLTSGSGTIESTERDYDGTQDHSLDCIWTIIAPVGQIIKLQFHYIYMIGWGWFCPYDVLKIFDGNFTDATLIAEICGYGIAQTLWSSSRIFYVYFHTDNIVSFEGFHASYSVHEAGTGPTSISTNASTESLTIMSTETSTVSAKTATETSTSSPPQTEGSTLSFGLSMESSSAAGSHITKATTVPDRSSTETSILMSTQDESSTSSIGSSAGSSSVISGSITEESITVSDKTSTETSTFFSTDNEGYASSLGSSTARSAIVSDSTTEKLTTEANKTSTETSKSLFTKYDGFSSSMGSGTENSVLTSRSITRKTTTVTDKTTSETSTLLSSQDTRFTSIKESSFEISTATSSHITEEAIDKTPTETPTLLFTQDKSHTSSYGLPTGSSVASSSHITEDATTITDKTSTETSKVLSIEDNKYTLYPGSNIKSLNAKSSDKTETASVTDKTSMKTSTVLSTQDKKHTSASKLSTGSSTAESSDVSTETTTDKTSTEASKKVLTEDDGQISTVRTGTHTRSSNVTETTSVMDKTSTEASNLMSTEGAAGIANGSSSTASVPDVTSEETKRSYSKSISSTDVTTDVEAHKKSTLSEILTEYRTLMTITTETTDRSHAESDRVTVYRMIAIYILICLFILQLH